MSADQLATQVAFELEADFGHGLVKQTKNVANGVTDNTRSLLTISAEIATIASLLVSLCKFAWDKYSTTKDRAEMIKVLENEIESIQGIDAEKRKKIINKIVDTLYS